MWHKLLWTPGKLSNVSFYIFFAAVKIFKEVKLQFLKIFARRKKKKRANFAIYFFLCEEKSFKRAKWAANILVVSTQHSNWGFCFIFAAEKKLKGVKFSFLENLCGEKINLAIGFHHPALKSSVLVKWWSKKHGQTPSNRVDLEKIIIFLEKNCKVVKYDIYFSKLSHTYPYGPFDFPCGFEKSQIDIKIFGCVE